MSVLQPIRVVLADDHEMVRQALAQILDRSEQMKVVGQAASPGELVEAVRKHRPEVVVLDYSMPGGDAVTTIQELLTFDDKLKILVLTIHENIHYAVRIIESGAHGYVVKSAAMSELIAGIEAVRQGETYVSPKVSQHVFQHLRSGKQTAGISQLSAREQEVLSMLGAGFGIKECAARLKISVSAASTYRARLLEKLGLKTTAEIIRFAIENDLVG
ncbi:MAG: response regulator transcription factor [Pirellulaceae bacterium]|nr:response regulator transcription factor [Planctomycetales bacterium]